MSLVHFQMDGPVAVIEIANPPVNALSHAVRTELLSALDHAADTPDVRAIVLCAAGRTFIAGADIKEFGLPPKAPLLPEVCNHIENSPVPVIAALHGTPLGGGLEVALSAHYRIAHPPTRMGLPEVRLGLLPGAGGTQRLPRLIPLPDAIEMITRAKDMDATRALKLGLIDRIAEGDAKAFGIAYAKELLSTGASARPTGRKAPPEHDENLFKQARASLQKAAPGQIAPLRALDAIEGACSLPFETGLTRERALFTELMGSDQRPALIHAFFAEKRAAKPTGITEVSPRPVSQVGIVGGGTMGSGIAAACLLAGFPVSLIEQDDSAADAARQKVRDILEGAKQRGKISATRHEQIRGQFHAGSDFMRLAQADLVIEAVFEDMDAKHKVFQTLDEVCKAEAILATNTSYLDVNAIAAGSKHPARVIGLHFFSPAHIMKLLEIVVGDQSANDVVASGFHLAKRLGKIAVRAGVCDGFIGNRILAHYRKALDGAVLAGATPQEVDKALVSFGLAMGPYAAMDLSGLDIAWANRKRLAATRDPNEVYAEFADTLCEAGHLGRKAGRGFYVYDEHPPAPNPILPQILREERARKGIAARPLTPEEIGSRFMAAMINEAARVVEDGIAERPSDVDVTLINGYGFPRWRGGPLHYADQTGLQKILDLIQSLSEEDPVLWQPAPLLVELARTERGFHDLN